MTNVMWQNMTVTHSIYKWYTQDKVLSSASTHEDYQNSQGFLRAMFLGGVSFGGKTYQS